MAFLAPLDPALDAVRTAIGTADGFVGTMGNPKVVVTREPQNIDDSYQVNVTIDREAAVADNVTHDSFVTQVNNFFSVFLVAPLKDVTEDELWDMSMTVHNALQPLNWQFMTAEYMIGDNKDAPLHSIELGFQVKVAGI